VTQKRLPRRALFVSSRICGTDGVSLEIKKWTAILSQLGIDSFFLCGLSDRPAEKSFLIELANFKHPVIQEINDRCFGRIDRTREMTSLIQNTASTIKNGIYDCIEQFRPDLVIAENSLTIPINIPLGIALDQVLTETQLPCIAHHHDFAWERDRFVVNAVSDFIDAHFPPRQKGLTHVVINTRAREELSRRTSLNSWVIPNVMDFDAEPTSDKGAAKNFRRALGIAPDETLLLQPTRVVARKGIEHSIELARALQHRRCKLVVTHATHDEGPAYLNHLTRFAEFMNVDLILAGELVGPAPNGSDERPFTICDAYQAADLVTFPSTYEGFGNAFLEAVFYRKLIFCNRYTIFQSDIEPLGFEVPMMDGFLDRKVIDEIESLLDDPVRREASAAHNFRIAKRHFSYSKASQLIKRLVSREKD
jgi:glycosyltransferase involved in cell wall biosynthesis